jgi:hypothetical protein
MVLLCMSVPLAITVYLLFGAVRLVNFFGRALREYYDSIETEDL